MSVMESNQMLTFKLGDETYGIQISKVREILTYPVVTPIPDASRWVKGVINLRGEVAPIIDLRVRFNTNDDPIYTNRTIVIAVKTQDMRMIGLVVDEVSDMENVELDRLYPAPDMGTSIAPEYLKGLFKKEDKMIVILDIDRILDKDEMQRLSRQSSGSSHVHSATA
ncbi:MAG: chemotaxis protein CheW [Sulfuricurvum sp. PD_MW2]|uniref:chemotaxis protein CheW n=1 Tax=Sulfuricurvum sp. PD_MW2 TaxID=2027917 RepID=UPI000C063C35|nr:chemotaxis protein CheW [Sulfuricurvum sp. PD_MW2]PHM17430.1 MAG: chemotaxis protein CheW [Sulfuricurvum sp. PD_MW2]